MKIITAKRAGFCFGVKRAVDMAFNEAGKEGCSVCTFGPIIHNPQVVQKLKDNGVAMIEDIDEITKKKNDTVIIRTHGVPEKDIDTLKKKGIDVIDATCPFVKKAQQYAKLLTEEGYKLVILGDKEHPEVKGIMSYAGENVTVVKSADDYPKISGKVGIIVQTTKQMDALKDLLVVAIEHAKELKVYNTICNSTALRMRETEKLAKKVDLMLIVGGKNSANTTRLAKFCRSMSVTAYHIETAEELDPKWFEGLNTIGITAGASTPDWIINDIRERINDIGGSACNGTSK